MRYTPSGIPVARFAVAVNRIRRKDASGEKSQDVDFINIVAWRRLAEICAEYLKKGKSVAVEGRLQIRSFRARNGEMSTMTEVIADNMQMLGRKTEVAEPQSPGEAVAADETDREEEANLPEEEIPF